MHVHNILIQIAAIEISNSGLRGCAWKASFLTKALFQTEPNLWRIGTNWKGKEIQPQKYFHLKTVILEK